MIDIHSHIIFDVDDGSKSIEDSIEMILEAKAAGFTDIIATPHYMENDYEVPKEQIKEKMDEIISILKENNVNINIHQGNEIYISNNIVELLNNNLATTLGESKYVLFETPMNIEPLNLLDVIYTLLENKNIPIIAHPERYEFIQKNPNKLIELLEDGVLFQANYGSVIGQYGKEAQKTVVKLLQNNMIHFMGTDEHRPNSVYTKVNTAVKELKKILPQNIVDEIITENAKKVLNNEEIEIRKPKEIKQSFFSKFLK